MKRLVLLIASLAASYGLPQSNYADQANNVAYIGEGLPPEAVLGGKITQLDDLSPEINLNKTKADLNCAAGSMQIDLKFKEPFYGIVYADFDRNSACQVAGKGALKYYLELPLKGCGTKQDPQRVFTNNIVVRSHPGLEMDGDEIVTIVCRYPPPIVQEPEPFISPEGIVAPSSYTPLSPLPVLLIICGILFLSLFLLGLAASYLCLRRRPLTIIRTHTPSESDIEKLSESSLALAPIHESSGSEYPGESPSEVEEHAVVHENASFSSEGYDYAQEQQLDQVTARPSTIPRLPIAVKEDSPKFSVQVKVRRPPPPSPPLSLTDSKSSRSESFAPPPPIQEEEVLELEEPVPAMSAPIVMHQPEITQHFVDDVYLRTIQEKKIIEDIDRQKRQVTQYHTEPKLLPPQVWDVTIKNFPMQAHPPQWEDFSDISSASGLSLTPKMPRVMSLPPQPQIDDDKIPLSSPELVGSIGQPPPPGHRVTIQTPPDRRVIETDLSTRRMETVRETTEREEWERVFNIPKDNPAVPNWSVLIRVLQPIEPEPSPVIDSAETYNSQLTLSDRMKWRQIITTESTLKTLLTEAIVREDFERISRDVRFEHIYEPPKWNVIIRILTPEDIGPDQKYVYPRRGSLPTLHEYDSDDGSSIREPQLYPSTVYRRSINKSEADLRSMSEMTVDFGRYPESSGRSQTAPDSPFLALHKSLSQPSLGRSISEFTDRDRWMVPQTPSEWTSTPEQTPRLQRSPKMKAFHLPRVRLDSGSSTRSGQAESSWQAMESSSMAQTPGGTTTKEVSREVRGATRAKWGKPARPGPKGWFPDSGSESGSK
ncbi:uncharacterized protein LOC109543961 isoform X1 [Dendroctonus ponderosae]|uniref:uncharacterized protein LOC109543961 isoform X1 n=1 Tax=Dendroctonus ponderosae TaxID=77166 RepID=UPI002035D630|nr:uncharacterized protein LOC109543961 isoform X1 [Dendroctonus ponderosae]XP_019769474.2 uncharacterized protein LOC109543961 isoform X1 [Dendroctonus ponderosae]